MSAIIKQSLRHFNSNNFIESLSEISPDTLYLFVGRSQPWSDEELPNTPIDTVSDETNIFKHIDIIKRIQKSEVMNVVKRIDWTNGVVYDEYDDQVDLLNGENPQTNTKYQFYVVTEEFNIYKCISNNNGSQSTSKPVSISTNLIETSDGYVWKYMYSLNADEIFNYLTTSWLPVKTLTERDGSAQWSVQQSAINGSIEYIKIINGGVDYDPNNPPLITITGDGTGATVNPQIDNITGTITKLNIINKGSGYTNITVNVDTTGTTGTGAVFRGIISPLGGHGSNAVTELGGNKVITKVDLGEEGGLYPSNLSFRQLGLMINPMSIIDGELLSLDNVTGVFNIGANVVDNTTGATGTVSYYDYYKKQMYVNVLTGTFGVGNTITGNNSYTATITNSTPSKLPMRNIVAKGEDIIPNQGEILYIDNFKEIKRSLNQSNDIRIILNF